MAAKVTIYQMAPQHHKVVEIYLNQIWGNSMIWTRGRVLNAAICQGLIACQEKYIVGLLTYQVANRCCEIVTINSNLPGKGVGSSLLTTFITRMKEKACSKCSLGVLNDNLKALHFFQKRGFTITSFSPHCIDQLRSENLAIPVLGINNIPLHGEYELERTL